MPESYRYIRVRMQLEQQRFLNFSFEAGTLQQDGDGDGDGDLSASLRLNRSLLIAVLAEIKTLFETYARKNGRYEPFHEVPKPSSRPLKADDGGAGDEGSALMELLTYDPTDDDNDDDSTTKDDRGSSEDKKTQRPLRPLRKLGTKIVQSGRNLRVVASEPHRLVWSMVDQESFERLVARLESLNSLLISLLDSSQTRQLQETMQITHQEVLQVRNDIGSKQLQVLGTVTESIIQLQSASCVFSRTIAIVPAGRALLLLL